MKKTAGTTIVELTLYMGLMMSFLLILTNVFVSMLDVQSESEAQSAIQQDGRYLLARLTYDVSRASALTIPSIQGAQTTTLALTIAGTSFTYQVGNGALGMTTGGVTDGLNSYGTTVSNFQVTRLGSGTAATARIAFRLTATVRRTGRGFESRNFQTTIGLR